MKYYTKLLWMAAAFGILYLALSLAAVVFGIIVIKRYEFISLNNVGLLSENMLSMVLEDAESTLDNANVILAVTC